VHVIIRPSSPLKLAADYVRITVCRARTTAPRGLACNLNLRDRKLFVVSI
jgi:hypothetical protein